MGNVYSLGDLCITDARGSSKQLVDAFRESDLRSWVHPIGDFNKALLEVLISGQNLAMPITLGTYTFRSPDQCPLPANFQASLTCMLWHNGEAEDEIWHFVVKCQAASASTHNSARL